ncbi:MAG TPA: serine/threonine protein kinase, partial [Intrasporangium sp.]|nr:serine/threonine protein kinase [Intrasporangium sp.]
MTSSVADALVGRVIDGRYRILSHLADGGMASVYVAMDGRLDREVALKIMRPGLETDAVSVERFRSEARAAARL